MKKALLTFALAAICLDAPAQIKPMKEYVDSLMAKMTVQEKIGQLNLLPANDATTGISANTPLMESLMKGQLGAILNMRGVEQIKQFQEAAVTKTRMGIPLIFGLDVIHGYETIFPVPLAMACSWDLANIERGARIAATEASADGINWTYSPMVDIALDARWGRIVEGAGEDPFLGSKIAAAYIKGYQGNLIKDNEILACIKHFGLYGAAEAGRDYNTVDMSRVRMYNQYLPPYKAAVEAGAGSIMSSFNVVDGVPATANHWLLDDLLRQQWGFKGFVVTDYGSIYEMSEHGIGDLQTSAAKAIKAGTDMDMCAESFTGTLEKSLKEGQVTMDDIDKACRRVLEAKYKLGLFSNPYKYCDASRRAKEIYTPDSRQAARNMAAESFVLLKNEGSVLPLKKKGTIALIGPLADTHYLTGSWSCAPVYDRFSTLKESMEQALKGKAKLLYTQGCNIVSDAQEQEAGALGKPIKRGDDVQMGKEALKIAKQADVIICAMGEEAEMSGESSSRADLELFDVQKSLLAELVKTGKPVILLNFSGRPTVLTWESKNVQAIMNVWFGGSECADAICDVVFGDKVPCGKLTVSMPQTTGQEPLYYNHLPTGRPVAEGTNTYKKFKSNYLDVRNDPLYPFGFGLSYTTFSYGKLNLSSNSMAPDGSITAKVTVTNTGNYDAYEVVQMYIHDIYASISRPVKELKGFQRVFLKQGESKEVTFQITPDLLKFYNQDLNYVLEPGDFDVMVGPDSSDKHLQKSTFTVSE
jgi:beta-glucosidase